MRVDVTVIREMLPISASLDVMGGDDVQARLTCRTLLGRHKWKSCGPCSDFPN